MKAERGKESAEEKSEASRGGLMRLNKAAREILLKPYSLPCSKLCNRTLLVVQWLRLHASNAGSTGSISGWGTEIPHAAWLSQKKKKKIKNDFIKRKREKKAL